MMAKDVLEINNFVTQIEELLRLHNVPAALHKCTELKGYIQIVSGAVE